MFKTNLKISIIPKKLIIKNNKTLNKRLLKSKNLAFLTTNIKQAFTKVLILNHFDPECNI